MIRNKKKLNSKDSDNHDKINTNIIKIFSAENYSLLENKHRLYLGEQGCYPHLFRVN